MSKSNHSLGTELITPRRMQTIVEEGGVYLTRKNETRDGMRDECIT